MEKFEKTFVYGAKERRKRTIRVFHLHRIVVLIFVVAIIAIGAVVFFAMKDNNLKNLDTRSFYFIQVGTCTASADALKKSYDTKQVGGSGYIINDGIFRIMATVFSSEESARSVRAKLLENGIECEIYKMSGKKLKMSKYDTSKDYDLVRSLLSFPVSRLFEQLQNQDIALDKGETSQSAVLLAVRNLKNELDANSEEIISLLARYPADKLLNSLQKTYSQIEVAINDYLPVSELIVGTNIKSILCAIAEIYIAAF